MRLCLFGHCARLYCLTVRCDAVLADLESLSVVAAILSVALLGAALYTRLHAPSALAIGLLMVLCILYAVRSRREQVRQASEERAVLSLNAHRCWDRHRCTRGFTVFVWSWNATMKKNQPWWALPPSVRAAPDPESACVVVVPRGDERRRVTLSELPGWHGGVNHVLVDQSDQGTSWEERRSHLGCAAIAQSHMDVRNYVHDHDVSLPLEGSRMGAGSLESLHKSLATTPATARRFWLTFRGATYPAHETGGGRTALLNLSRFSTSRRPIVVAESCHKVHGEHLLPENRPFCEGLDRGMAAAPRFLDLFNSTFALVPGGRQPASYRLNEVMAAGCIPVFVTGEASEGASPYVRPFHINWGAISLHVPFGEPAEDLVASLARLSDERILRMQNGVLHAWKNHLAPNRVATTFYDILEARSFGRRLSERRPRKVIRKQLKSFRS